MNILYTPEERFANLPGYDFQPNYVEVADGLKMHYLDEGPKDAVETLLLMHGEPSWSYLYRTMIPVFTAAGYRCIVPDLIGFGRSGKPAEQADYTYAKHIEWCQSLLQQIGIQEVTLFAQDWGGLIGLRLVTAEPDRFKRIVIGNTGLPTGDQKMPEAFLKWQHFSQTTPVFPIGDFLQGATKNKLSKEIVAAYDAPYPDDSYKAGARIFPALVPSTPDNVESENNRQAWQQVFMKWEKPFLTLFSDSDPITKGGERVWQKLVPGTKGQPHEIIENGGHFLQEDQGEVIAEKIVNWIKNL
ncbi:MAG: haloalkane dehalogenase [Saprospiraceae bacterium]